MAHDVFISYSHKDKAIAIAVCGTLEGRGVRCWIAPRDIQPSSNWTSAIMDGISQSQAMVLIWSANASDSSDVTREVHHAFRKGVAVVPFRIEDVAFRKELEFFLETVHWLDALTPPLEAHLQNLAQVIERLLKKDETETVDRATLSPSICKPKTERGVRAPSLSVRGTQTADAHPRSSSGPISRLQQLIIGGLVVAMLVGIIAAVSMSLNKQKSAAKNANSNIPLMNLQGVETPPPTRHSWRHKEMISHSRDDSIHAHADTEILEDQNKYFVNLSFIDRQGQPTLRCCVHSFEIQRLLWSPDDKILVSEDKNTLVVWDIGTLKKKWGKITDDAIWKLSFVENGRFLLCLFDNGRAEKWDVNTGAVVSKGPSYQDLNELVIAQ